MILNYIKQIFHNTKIFVFNLFFPSNIKIIGKCSMCGACCKKLYATYNNKPITNEDDFIELKNSHQFFANLEIIGLNVDGELIFKCNLLQDNKCSKYRIRHYICRRYPYPQMFNLGGSLFETCSYQIVARKDFKFFMKN